MHIRPYRLFTYALCGWLPGGRRRCIACDHRVWRFMPYRGVSGTHGLMYALDVIGSDVKHFECPRCGSHDRERHLMMYLRASGMLPKLEGADVLHFAPEKHLGRIVREAGVGKYIPCDLYPQGEGVRRVDMENMTFADGSFDAVIANHVLEHVTNAGRALNEIHRVLKPGGHAILQTPYASKLHNTWQDAGIDTPESRLYAHGQEDHVRLFGRDIFDFISRAGFRNLTRDHNELLADVDAARYGVNSKEPFFLFRKEQEKQPQIQPR